MRNLTERDEGVHHGEWRGTTPQQQVRAPCDICGRHLEDDQRFAFGGWLVHRRCAVESVAGADGRGDDRFGIAIRDGTLVPRRRTFRLTAIVPTIHMRYDRTTPEGAHQQRQLETSWPSLTSGVEEASSQGEGGQDVERGLEESANFGAHTAVGLWITLVESPGKTALEYPYRAPMKALCTPAAC